jgi:hypothetical protein
MHISYITANDRSRRKMQVKTEQKNDNAGIVRTRNKPGCS